MSRKSWGATWPACYARRGKRRAVQLRKSSRNPLLQRWPRRAGSRAPWIRADCTGGLPATRSGFAAWGGSSCRTICRSFSGPMRPFSGAMAPIFRSIEDTFGPPAPSPPDFPVGYGTRHPHSVREFPLCPGIFIPSGNFDSRTDRLRSGFRGKSLIAPYGRAPYSPAGPQKSASRRVGADLKPNAGVVSTFAEMLAHCQAANS